MVRNDYSLQIVGASIEKGDVQLAQYA